MFKPHFQTCLSIVVLCCVLCAQTFGLFHSIDHSGIGIAKISQVQAANSSTECAAPISSHSCVLFDALALGGAVGASANPVLFFNTQDFFHRPAAVTLLSQTARHFYHSHAPPLVSI